MSEGAGAFTALWAAWFNQLYQIYSKNLQISLGVPNNSTTAIAQLDPGPGDVVFDSTLNKWKGWNGTDWEIFTTTPA